VVAERRRVVPGLYASPDRLARAARAVAVDAQARHRTSTRTVAEPALRLGPDPLDEVAAKAVFERVGLRTPRRAVCATRAEAEAALADLTGPVVLKVLAADVPHKSDVDGVHVGVRTVADLHAAMDRIDAIGASHRYLVEEQAEPGVELIVGGVRDSGFGPCVMLGLGGVAVDLAPEPALRLAPVSRADAVDMVAALPERVLAGLRGQPPVDVAAVADVIGAVSDVFATYADVTDVDINPLRLTRAGPIILDALIVVGPTVHKGQTGEFV
jgi:acetyltransferase